MEPEPLVTIGWDVGGVQVKAARVESRATSPPVVRTAVRALEIWRGRDQLPSVLRELAEELSIDGAAAHALTMTAELSDAFRDKREGVLFVMDGVDEALPGAVVFALDNDGDFAPLPVARARPLAFAATNWLASALHAASRVDECILIDVGSTTTDIVPIRQGRLACEGRTDLDRLVAGELVYTGVLRTNPNTLTATVPVRGRPCRLAAEHFSVMADVYLLLGLLRAEEYACPTPDGRAVSPAASRERLARLVCADRETLSEGEIAGIGALRERATTPGDRRGASPGPVAVGRAHRDHRRPSRCRRLSGVSRRRASRPRGAPPGVLWGAEGVALPAAAAACLLGARIADKAGPGSGAALGDTRP